MNGEGSGEDVASVKETEMRSNKVSVNENGDSVSGFDSCTCSGDNFYEILKMRTKLLLKNQLFGSTLIQRIVKEGS